MKNNQKEATRKEDVKPIEIEIINYIHQHHPECSATGFTMNADFIRLVLDTANKIIIDRELGLEPGDLDDEPTDEEAEEILRNMPQAAITQPLARESVRLIHEEYVALSYRKFLAESADDDCAMAWEFNNRANARAGLGRYLEAQMDYNRACDIDPNDSTHFLNRAGLFVSLGVIDDALRDCLHVSTLLREDDIAYYGDLFMLANIFRQCGEYLLAAQSLLKFLKLVKSLIPYTRREGDSYIIQKDGHTIHTTSLVDLEEISSFIKNIEDDGTCGENKKFGSLVETIKGEFSALKVLVGII